MTATQPQKNRFLTVYPNELAVPNASNLHFRAGETVPNLALVADSGLMIGVYDHSSGTVEVIVDEEGYYIARRPGQTDSSNSAGPAGPPDPAGPEAAWVRMKMGPRSPR
ncbi:hypothetical protein [Streptomyces longisporus]|uniref:Uncharacterized protein n=1 Tax=Streptomyces longisporus TaxID=1948 RepID=A0ABP5ZGQ4_STRLO